MIKPRYGVASLSDILPSALAVLGVPGTTDVLGVHLDGVRRVAVLLVDGLGWHQLPVAAPVAPTLAGLAASGRELTCGFPSTTPTSLVTVGTGVPPGTHGIVGFNLRVPETGSVLNHLHWRDEPDPRRWQPVTTRFEQAAAAGVAVTVVSRPEFEDSGLTVAAFRGATYRGASDVDAVVAQTLAALLDRPAPALVYSYHPDVDRIGHVLGVGSEPWLAAVAEVDRMVTRIAERLPADAALLVTADHGQLNVPADKKFDLDTDARLRAGVATVAGEARVRYLHTLPGATADVLATWRGILGAAAHLTTRDEAAAEGWFGPVAPEHLDRIGDVVAFCNDAYVVLASKTEPPHVALFEAYHGSYSDVEMAVPLLVVRGG